MNRAISVSPSKQREKVEITFDNFFERMEEPS